MYKLYNGKFTYNFNIGIWNNWNCNGYFSLGCSN